MRIGMIGLGVIAPFYAAALDQISSAELSAVCDINPARIVRYRRSGLREFTDYRSLLEWSDVDAVLINAPNDQHFTLAGAALAAGKHVCCEKPLTTRLTDALELLEIARRSSKTLFTAFHRRYNRNFRLRLPELSDHSKIASVSAEYLELIQDHAGSDGWYLDPKRCGGGCIADNGPNVFDSLCSFLGPLKVTGVQVVRNQSIDVKASVQCLSHEEIPVQVFLDWEYDQGEKKQLKVMLKDGQTICVDFLEGFSEFKGSLWHEYEGVIDDFLGHVRRGQSDSRAGCEAVRLVEESYAKEVAA